LNGFSQHKLLTAAAPAYPVYTDPPTSEAAMFASLQTQFDQINIMTYDLSGPYEGWVSWFNSPIYDGGYRFPSTGGLVPSVDGAVNNFIVNGVAPGKLGIGLPFYGYIWTGGPGVTGPRQSWPTNSVPTVSTPTYATIMNSYYQSKNYHWDTNAQAAYLAITNSPASTDDFISYDDQHTAQAKVSYARNQGLGGIMIWELSEDYFPTLPVGQRTPLVQTIKQSLDTPGMTTIHVDGQDINLSFFSLPLADYRILWTSNLEGTWFTLTNNVPGTGGILQINDPTSPTQPVRYYRIKTPP
jgi:GH18 family chitinase